MTTRPDVERLAGAARSASDLAVVQLTGWFLSLELSSPERVRDALLEVVPDIVEVFGGVASAGAAEWYESVRGAQVPGLYEALAGATAPREAVEGSVRYAAGALWTDVPTDALATLAGAVQRHVTYSSRETVARNVARDPAKPRYARVPRGAKTCAWCSMLSSRGFVYHSKASAGEQGHFHDDCDCAQVPEWDADGAHIEGYDPDEMYAQYMAAREATGLATPSQKQIAEQMRRLFPESFTDGVFPDSDV